MSLLTVAPGPFSLSAVYDGGSVVKEGEEARRKRRREREREREEERERGRKRGGEREICYQVGMQFVDTAEHPVCDSIG